MDYDVGTCIPSNAGPRAKPQATSRRPPATEETLWFVYRARLGGDSALCITPEPVLYAEALVAALEAAAGEGEQ